MNARKRLRASILAVGDELTLGQKVDTNSAWLSERLVEASVTPAEHRTVPDDRAALAEAIDELAGRSDVLIVTGGLGPTPDDLTREALGDVLTPGRPLVRDAEAVEAISRMFTGRGLSMPRSNLAQADRPSSMAMMPNDVGTAPGLRGEHRGCAIFVLPGPPFEVSHMFERCVLPALPPAEQDHRLLTETVHMYGIGEAAAAEMLGDLTDRDRDPRVGTTASRGVITARVLSTGPLDDAQERLLATVEEIERLWAPYGFGRGKTTLAAAAGDTLRPAGAKLVTAESCTGGLLGGAIVDAAGASDFYLGGWVTYSNEMKTSLLHVDPGVIDEHGAVSAATARAMAEGALAVALDADYSLAITGVAGPGASSARDGVPAKPAGLVFVGLGTRATSGEVASSAREFRFRGDRSAVRDRSVKSALQVLRLAALGREAKPLLWEAASELATGEAGGA